MVSLGVGAVEQRLLKVLTAATDDRAEMHILMEGPRARYSKIKHPLRQEHDRQHEPGDDAVGVIEPTEVHGALD